MANYGYGINLYPLCIVLEKLNVWAVTIIIISGTEEY